MSNLSLALDYAMAGRSVRGYHVTNLALHAATAALLYLLLAGTLRRRWPTLPSEALAFAVALAWTVHPLQTEPVAYAVQRTELLFGFWLLVTLWAADRAWDGRRGFEALAVAACALGMGTKETMVAAPLLVGIWDVVIRRAGWREFRMRRRLYLGLAATWLILAGLLATGEQWGVATVRRGGPTPWGYLCAQAPVLLHYLRLCVWPTGLRLVYDWPASRPLAEALVPGAAVVALLGGGLFALARRHWLALPAALFFLVLAPTSSLLPLPTEVVAERRMHVPLAAVIVVLAAGLVAAERALGGPRPGRVTAAVLVGLCLPLAVASRQRLRAYASPVTLWADASLKSPGSAVAHYNLGNAFNREGRLEEALAEYSEAYRVDPHYWEAHSNRAALLIRRGRLDEAAAELRATLALRPDHPPSHLNLGTYLATRGRTDDARREFETALRLDPDYALARRALAELDARTPAAAVR